MVSPFFGFVRVSGGGVLSSTIVRLVDAIVSGEADRVFEHTFRIPSRHQGYLEPHASLVAIDDDGRIEVWACTKAPFRVRTQLAKAGFREIRVEREKREDMVQSFDDYWNPIEAGTGSLPQAYLALSETDRLSVRQEVREGLSKFEANGRLFMSIEMLIGSGRA